MKKTFYIIQLFLGLLVVILIYFSSNFSIGSREDKIEQISNHPVEYFASRLVFNIIIYLIPLLILIITTKIYSKKGLDKHTIKQSVIGQLLLFFLISIILIGINLIKYM